MDLDHELEVARTAALRAGESSLRFLKSGITAESKPDASPVTIADLEAERLISAMLTEAFPGDGLLGEEGAALEAANGRRWIIDPIDGTRDFLRGIPTWSVLIGLEQRGKVVAGVAHFPALGTTYTAIAGRGAWRDGSPIRVSAIDSPEQAVLSVSGFNYLDKLPFAGRLIDWMPRFWAVRSMGGCLDAVMIAAGQSDVWIEPSAAAWDLAPLVLLIEEAGGRFFNFDGGSSIYAGNGVACTPGLEAELRTLVGC